MLFRQTNIVWVVFVGGAVSLSIIEPCISQLQKSQLTKEGEQNGAFVSSVVVAVKASLQCIPAVVYKVWPHLLVVLLFLVFVTVNGSIVVGDKSHHQASLHFPQLLYFSWYAVHFYIIYF